MLHMTAGRSVMGILNEIVRSWLSRDRIRISPTSGSLLRLVEGNRFLFRDEIFEVTACDWDCKTSQLVVDLMTDEVAAKLFMRTASDGTATEGRLISLGRTTIVFEDDIVILGRHP